MNGTDVQPQSSLDSMVNAFASGFVSSTERTILFVVIIALIIAVLVVIAITQIRRSRRRSRAHAAETFDILASKHQLSRSQRDLAEQLAACHRVPERKHEVLVNRHIFNECVGIAREKGEIPEVALSALRLKLGFVEIGPEEVPQSTEEIPIDSSMILVPARGKSQRVRVKDQRPEGIVVRADNASLRFSLGTLLSARFANRSGLYRFETHVNEIEGDSILLDHSDDIRRIQRRRFYRKKTGLTVLVTDLDFETEFFETMILDLSGAGAAISNRDDILQGGMEIGLKFTLADEKFNVPGRVLYISEVKNIAHIAFEKLALSVQDRIIRGLLSL